MTVWRSYDALYDVSDDGQVRRMPKGRPVKPFLMSTGYYYVSLSHQGVVQNVAVHHMVCTAFHGPNPGGRQVAHWNGIRTDNAPGNLRWATALENAADRLRHMGVAPRARPPHRTVRVATSATGAFIAGGHVYGFHPVIIVPVAA